MKNNIQKTVLIDNKNIPEITENCDNHSQFISHKSPWVAIILNILFGHLGIHQFYMGNTTKGIIQLIMTISVFLYIITIIWTFIDAILILLNSAKDESNKVLKFKTTVQQILAILIYFIGLSWLFCILITFVLFEIN